MRNKKIQMKIGRKTVMRQEKKERVIADTLDDLDAGLYII